jgi:hypothetical protein
MNGLRDLRKRAKELAGKKERLERMRASVERSTPVYGAIGSGGQSDRQQTIARIIDMERELIEQTILLTDTQLNAMQRIEELPDAVVRQMMELRYIDNRKWREIEDELHYTHGWLMKRHRAALRKLENKS